MRVLSKSTLREFWTRHPRAEQPLTAWYDVTKKATWQHSADLKQTFATASIITSERVVFNIHGNDYRLVAHIDYEFKLVFIRFIGTHREYDKIDAATVRLF
jgi:mRNA interferase HigB